MKRNVASTDRHERLDPAAMADVATDPLSVDAADAAEAILGRYLKPGRWAARRVRSRFVQCGELERVLALYEDAMATDPLEPAYPWNLAVALDRLGLHDLALAYVQRALRVATEVGDEEWADAQAHLAWAEIALNAGQPEIALIAIDQAASLDSTVAVEAYRRRARHSAGPREAANSSDNRDAARKGKAVEHLVASSVMIASGFELNVSTSFVDDEGVDLIFHRRDSPVTLSVQVKSRSWESSTMLKSSKFTAQVRETTFADRGDLYMLFVAVDSRAGDYGPVWLVPSSELAERTSPNTQRRRRFAASAKPTTHDQWSGFRLERSQLSNRILAILTDLEAAQSP